MKGILQGLEDVKAGRYRSIDEISKDLGI